MALKRGKARTLPGIAFEIGARVRERVKAMLPFKPTGAQKRVIQEIADDMKAPHPMNRLLQGDVGSGKTIVAAEAAVIAIENGYQVAVLAPTEILAAQHAFYFKQILSKLGYVTVLLTGSFTSREKAQLKKLVAEGLAHVAIGTHALLEKDVEFHKLGLAIIDEQHRFGVLQRLGLVEKGVHPDVLVMTATPIPRTLAMTIYGDLDVSVIDEMPPGRKPIVTKHATADQVEQVYSFMKRQIDEGRQAYVVYPVIEESETQAMKAAQKMYEHLSREVFPDIPVGLMHGRLGGDEKEAVMQRFKEGLIKILVSTTVIEVGMDVRQRQRHGGGAGRALRPGPVAPASRARGPRRRAELLHPGDRENERRRARAHTHPGGIHRRLLHFRNGPEAARPRRVLRHQTIGPSVAAGGQHPARRRNSGGGAPRGRGFHRAPAFRGRSAARGGLYPRPLAAPLRPGDGGLMRIIAGEFRSRRLKSIPGAATRPTPDRLRETLFDILAPRIAGATFLDAYAGTGAVGMEALSRGAAHAFFLERHRAALEAIRQNLASLGVEPRATVVAGPVLLTLPKHHADIVFLDPPYDLEREYAAVLEVLCENPPVIAVVQHSVRFALGDVMACCGARAS